jgi:hypothetical protein
MRRWLGLQVLAVELVLAAAVDRVLVEEVDGRLLGHRVVDDDQVEDLEDFEYDEENL